jgi:hypothetical protein
MEVSRFGLSFIDMEHLQCYARSVAPSMRLKFVFPYCGKYDIRYEIDVKDQNKINQIENILLKQKERKIPKKTYYIRKVKNTFKRILKWKT